MLVNTLSDLLILKRLETLVFPVVLLSSDSLIFSLGNKIILDIFLELFLKALVWNNFLISRLLLCVFVETPPQDRYLF